MRLSEHFRLEEFACPCGCGGEIVLTARLIGALEHLRELVGRPILVNSGFRCLKYNRKIGSKDTSQHVLGTAADIVTNNRVSRRMYPMTPWDVRKHALKVPAFNQGGIGIYNTFLHVDVRPDGPTRWDETTLPF